MKIIIHVYIICASQQLLGKWLSTVKAEGICCSDSFSLSSTLADLQQIMSWCNDGLPKDSFAVDNAVILRYIDKMVTYNLLGNILCIIFMIYVHP